MLSVMRTAPLTLAVALVVASATVALADERTVIRSDGSTSRVDDGRNTAAENQAAAAARAQVNRARGEMEFVRVKLRKTFEASPQWRQASADLKQAQTDYDVASKPVLEKLRADPKYRQATEQKTDAKRDVAEAHADVVQDRGGTTPATQPVTGEVVEAANASLAAGQELSRLEQSALDADPKVTDAKNRRDVAAAKVRALEDGFEADLMNNTGFQQAKVNLEQAEANLVAQDRRGQ